MNDIPEGPVLFLREWGLTLQRPMPRRAREHKRELIEDMLARYPDFPFLLIGDSGQHDPEVYANIVRDHPNRVEAVYIRDVTLDEGRSEEIQALWRATRVAECPLIVTDESSVMAEHAVESGFIADEVLEAVAGRGLATSHSR